jgi:hypothetical protein
MLVHCRLRRRRRKRRGRRSGGRRFWTSRGIRQSWIGVFDRGGRRGGGSERGEVVLERVGCEMSCERVVGVVVLA